MTINRDYRQKVATTVNWSVEYDEHHVAELLLTKTEMTFAETKNVILNEGGFVDDNGIIHKGTATNKIYTV